MIVCVTLSFLSLGFARGQSTPVARYDFQNASALGEDSSGSGASHAGVVNGSPTLDATDAKVGSSSIRMFGDQNQYIEVPDHSELDATDQLTVSFWAKPTAMGVDDKARGIVSKRVGYNNNVSYSMFLPNSGAELTLYLDDGDNQPNTITTGYTFQTSWQHVSMVFDGTLSASDRVKLYVNGALFDTYSHSASQIRDLNGPLTIGSLNPDYDAGGSSYISYDGWLDDVQVHRDALSASEVSTLFTGGGAPGGEVILDSEDAAGVTVNGTWIASTSTSGYEGGNYLHDDNSGQGSKSVVYAPTLQAGTHDVYMKWTSHANRASNVPVDIDYDGGVDQVLVNQTTGGGQWTLLGSYPFAAGSSGTVTISNAGANGYVIADAVRFVPQAISPVAYWDFDDGSGSVAMDLSANALDIALQGTYSWTTGQVGGALDLGGQTTSYGTLADPDVLEDTDKLSFAFWVKPENLDTHARFVVSKRDAQDVNSSFSLFFWKSNRLYVDLDKNNNGNRHSTATQFENDTWYHVGVVYDGTLPEGERGRVYIDGELDANSPFGVSSASIPNYASDLHLGIANVGYMRTFGGVVDDLMIFRAALSEAEVEDVAGMGDDGPVPEGIIYQTSFDDMVDFTATMHGDDNPIETQKGDILPEGYYGLYEGTQWSPETGYPDKHASLEILASNADKARGGTGKSAVFWREAYRISTYTEPQVLNAGTWVRVRASTSTEYGTEKTATLTIDGQDHVYSLTTIASEGDPIDTSNPSGDLTSLIARTNQPLHTTIYSNPIEIVQDGTVVSITGGDFQTSTNQGGDWSGWKNWGSDSQLIRLLGGEYTQLYCEFYVRFSDNWWHRTGAPSNFQTKMFRVGHWDEVGPIYNGNSGTVNPRFIWGYKRDSYGVRSLYTFLQGPPGQGGGDLPQGGSKNYTSHTVGMAPGGVDPYVPNLDGPGSLLDISGSTTHAQVFGPGAEWTKVAFFLKLNSAPGVADGVFKHWHNDVRIRNYENVEWVGENPGGDLPGWNYFAIGGNSYFQAFPNSDQFEDWRAMDDLTISTEIPEGLE